MRLVSHEDTGTVAGQGNVLGSSKSSCDHLAPSITLALCCNCYIPDTQLTHARPNHAQHAPSNKMCGHTPKIGEGIIAYKFYKLMIEGLRKHTYSYDTVLTTVHDN